MEGGAGERPPIPVRGWFPEPRGPGAFPGPTWERSSPLGLGPHTPIWSGFPKGVGRLHQRVGSAGLQFFRAFKGISVFPSRCLSHCIPQAISHVAIFSKDYFK